jgi:hypothetical protein
MKKLAIILLGILVLGTSACRKVTQEYYTIPNKTIFAKINSWTTNDGGRTYSATVDMPEINETAYDLDGILVYGTFEDGEDEPIPQVYNGFAYNFAVGVGYIVIKVQSVDLTPFPPPPALPIKMVLLPSEE